MPYQTTQHNFTFLGLAEAILNWGHTLQQVIHEPQPEGPTNTLRNCICTSCFYITACLNIVTNVCSMPATRLKQWTANKSDTLLCHVAHISDNTHAN
jgi:hypothetical protein